jgi:hypothetical protein
MWCEFESNQLIKSKKKFGQGDLNNMTWEEFLRKEMRGNHTRQDNHFDPPIHEEDGLIKSKRSSKLKEKILVRESKATQSMEENKS